MLLLALPLGLAIGVTLGALGGGGAIIAVPALVFILGQDPRTATTSSLVIVGLTSLIALMPHARAGRVRFVQGLGVGGQGRRHVRCAVGRAAHDGGDPSRRHRHP